MRVLLKSGASLAERTGNGDTPLHMAVFRCQFEAVQMLLENGADLNFSNSGGQTPLSIAEMLDELRKKNPNNLIPVPRVSADQGRNSAQRRCRFCEDMPQSRRESPAKRGAATNAGVFCRLAGGFLIISIAMESSPNLFLVSADRCDGGGNVWPLCLECDLGLDGCGSAREARVGGGAACGACFVAA